MILDRINSTVYLVTFDDLYNQTAQFKKYKLRLNNGFKTVHHCFFQGEKSIVCLGVEGYFAIEFKVNNSRISVTKNRFHKYDNFLVKQIAEEQIIVSDSKQVLVETNSGDNIVYIHITNGVVKMYFAKQSKQAIKARLFELKHMREPSDKESFENSENEFDDDEIKPENLAVLKVKFLLPMSEFNNNEVDYTHINGSFFQVGKRNLGFVSNLKIQYADVPQGEKTSGVENIIYEVSNSSILNPEEDFSEEYVEIYSKTFKHDNSRQYFIDHNEGNVSLYKFNSEGERLKLRKPVTEPQLITVKELPMVDEERKFSVEVKPIPVPTKNFQFPQSYTVEYQAQIVSADGKVTKPEEVKDLTKITGTPEDIAALGEGMLKEIFDISYLSGFHNSLIPVDLNGGILEEEEIKPA